jgi:hypothetical protein
MKKQLLLSFFLLCGFSQLSAQLSTGDLAFTGFNADGADGFAFVLFQETPANTLIRFCDSEWDGTAFGSDEGDFTWDSGNAALPAGTVVEISALGDLISATSGSIIIDNSGGISSNSEAMFAFIGPDERTPDVFLGAIANNDAAFGDLSGSGLQVGLTAQVLASGTDIAAYTGQRTGLDQVGYLLAMNDLSNWASQDTEFDDNADGITPDLPFDLTPFVISSEDLTAPQALSVQVIDQFSLEVSFSEALNAAEAADANNFVLTPSANVQSAVYDPVNFTVTLTIDPLQEGVATTLSVSGISDDAGNVMTPYTSDAFFFNGAFPNLVFTEIMYNPPADESDNLEFVEIWNAGETVANLGGFVFVDEGNFSFTFPEVSVAPGTGILLATDAVFAESFYGVPFLDYLEGEANALGNGGEVLTLFNSTGDVVAEVEYDDGAPWDSTADGDGPSLERTTFDADPLAATSWVASENLVGLASDGTEVFASPGSFSPVQVVSVSFVEAFTNVNEDSGVVAIELDIVEGSGDFDFEIVVSGVSSAADGVHFEYSGELVELPAGTSGSYFVEIPIIDDFLASSEVFFTLELIDGQNAEAGAQDNHTVFIQDNETVEVPQFNSLSVDYLSSYLVDPLGTAEIVVFDAGSQRLFVLNSEATKVHILDFSDPENIVEINQLDMTLYGTGATSVTTNGEIVAASVDSPEGTPGRVVFLDLDGNYLNDVEVGFLPDMVAFSHDGSFVLVSNEGEPSAEYAFDPEGTISRIDIPEDVTTLTDGDVITMTFNAFDADIETLRAEGVRIFGLNATVSQDMEPEFVAISDDNTLAWVTLQENNAVAVVDLTTNTIADILALGTKDHSLPGNELDISDRNDSVFFANWDVKGMYMPDAIAQYTVGGVTYLVTANEGDQREYGVIDEDTDINDLDLDPTAYPFADLLREDHLLGRIAATPYDGDTDGDGDIDEIHIFGARSFSIWNASTGEQVYDSGSDFERFTANDPVYGSIFNASNSNNNFKNRSDNKGPEPEGVSIAEINGRIYAFIGLERIGGIATYDVTDPTDAKFIGWSNNRGLGEDESGDLGAEGITYISSENHTTGRSFVVVANEVSATISVFEVTQGPCSAADLNSNGTVDSADLLDFLAAYGCMGDCGSPDFDFDATVGVNDLLFFLSQYGQVCY